VGLICSVHAFVRRSQTTDRGFHKLGDLLRGLALLKFAPYCSFQCSIVAAVPDKSNAAAGL